MRPPGSRLVTTGVVLLVISVAIGLIGSILTASRIDQSSLTRDVVIAGKGDASIPGTLSFEVTEPLSEKASSEMLVGVVLDPVTASEPECQLREQEGDPITLRWVSPNDSLVSPTDPRAKPVAVSRLGVGHYQVRCEPSSAAASPARSFTVTRVIGPSDLMGELSPILWFGGVVVLAGLFFLAGTITLVIGLVKRRTWRRMTGYR